MAILVGAVAAIESNGEQRWEDVRSLRERDSYRCCTVVTRRRHLTASEKQGHCISQLRSCSAHTSDWDFAWGFCMNVETLRSTRTNQIPESESDMPNLAGRYHPQRIAVRRSGMSCMLIGAMRKHEADPYLHSVGRSSRYAEF